MTNYEDYKWLLDILGNFRQKLLVAVIFLSSVTTKSYLGIKYKGRSGVIFVWDGFLNIVLGL